MSNQHGRNWQSAELKVFKAMALGPSAVMMCPFGGCAEKFRDEQRYKDHVATHPHQTGRVKRDWTPPWQNLRRT